MDQHDLDHLEHDPRFPSGPWQGFFLQWWFRGRQPTSMRLSWRDGDLTGTGSDWVGPYTIEGQYDRESGRCAWTKQYLGKHSVCYRGVNDGRGIWGVWEIRLLGGLYLDRGGFHIWPEGTDVSAESDETEHILLGVMREEFGRNPVRMLRGPLLLTLAGALAAGLIAALAIQALGGWGY
jgi:hypothetical protein